MRRSLLLSTVFGLLSLAAVLPALAAEPAAPAQAPAAQPAQKIVTVTLVRWPYT